MSVRIRFISAVPRSRDPMLAPDWLAGMVLASDWLVVMAGPAVTDPADISMICVTPRSNNL